MIVDNWEVLDDPILPPAESSWFGSIPQIKAIEVSPGWTYATDDPVGHFGDADRIYPVSHSSERLTWRLPRIVDFTVSLYVTDVQLLDKIELSASSDRERWTALAYEAVVRRAAAVDAGDGRGMLAVELTGRVPPELQGAYFQITIEPGRFAPGELQIGHVHLRGAAGDR